MTILACTIDGCERPIKTQGLCNGHYLRVRTTGEPGNNIFQRRYFDSEEAFAAHTTRQGDHLIWSGSKLANGYPTIRANGKQMLAHRYSYERSIGPIPDGLVIDHICRVPACVEPSHLRAVTQKQNTENVDSPMRGVTWDAKNQKWRVKVTHNYKTIHIGRYSGKDEAVAAARAARIRLFTCNDADRAA